MILEQSDGLKANENIINVMCEIFGVSKDALVKTGGINANSA
jgi:hypothetical protein